jgi:hypothetical protein
MGSVDELSISKDVFWLAMEKIVAPRVNKSASAY